jgi:ribosomal protein S12 methylthiotransferase accessory factor
VTRLALETVDDPCCQGLLDQLRRAGFTTAVWDITSNIGIPAFYSVIIDRLNDAEHLGVGAGCHPDRSIALLRALTEAAQVRLTYITGARDDLTPFEFSRAGRAQKLVRAGLLTASDKAPCDFRSLPSQTFATFDEDIDWMLHRLRAVGLEQAIVVDLTQPAFGLPVVRTIVPGLEGIDGHAGYRPGRRAITAEASAT